MAKKNIGTKIERPKITVSERKEKRKEIKAKKHSTKAPKVFIILLSILIVLAIAAAIFVNWGRLTGAKEDRAATINGQAITLAQLDDYYSRLAPQVQASVTKTQLLDDMINKKLLTDKAKELGISANESEVNDYIAGFLAQANMTIDELNSRLATQNITLKALTDDVNQQLTINKLFQQEIVDKINVTDQEILDYYNNNLDLFKVPEQVRVEHILICYNESLRCTSNLTKEDALVKIKEIKSMVNATNFESLAEKYSQDPSGANGGDLGYFEKGAMVKSFEDAAFSLNIGDVSGAIETPYGFHILKVLDIKAATVQKFDDVKEEIRQTILSQKQKDGLQKYIDDLKAKAIVIVYYNETASK